MPTFITPQGDRYIAERANTAEDIGVLDYPTDGLDYEFDFDKWQWVIKRLSYEEQIQAHTNAYAPYLKKLREEFEHAQMMSNSHAMSKAKTEYKSLVNERDSAIKILEELKEAEEAENALKALKETDETETEVA